MHDLLSQCKLKGSPGHGQTGEGLVRLSVNRVFVHTEALLKLDEYLHSSFQRVSDLAVK